MMCKLDRAVGVESENRPGCRVGELDAALAIDQHDADRQRTDEPHEGAVARSCAGSRRRSPPSDRSRPTRAARRRNASEGNPAREPGDQRQAATTRDRVKP